MPVGVVAVVAVVVVGSGAVWVGHAGRGRRPAFGRECRSPSSSRRRARPPRRRRPRSRRPAPAAPARSSRPGTSPPAGASPRRGGRTRRDAQAASRRTRGSTPGRRCTACCSAGSAGRPRDAPLSAPRDRPSAGSSRRPPGPALRPPARLRASGSASASGSVSSLVSTGRPHWAQKVASAESGCPQPWQATTGSVADRPPAVRAEVRAPGNRRAALAGRRRAPGGRDRLEHRVELAKPVLERDDLPALLDQQLVAEARAPVHLQRQPAEVADTLLARLHDRAPLAPERPGRRRTPEDRLRPGCGTAAGPPV